MRKDESQKSGDGVKHTRNSALGKRGVNKRRRKANKILTKKPEDIRGKQ
jgi:hypothetical protein